MRNVITTMLLGLALGVSASGSDCLIFNGDAELGSTLGWTPPDQVSAASSDVAGVNGLPAGYDLGSFIFWGQDGPPTQVIAQTIDLSVDADEIDGGRVTGVVSGALQSRVTADGQFVDFVTVDYDFRDGDGTSLLLLEFEDPIIIPGAPADWAVFDETITLPVGARELVVTMTMIRPAGASTDAYADNLCFTHSAYCVADFDGDDVVGPADLAVLLSTWNGFDPAINLDGDGVVGAGDLAVLLASWGPCP